MTEQLADGTMRFRHYCSQVRQLMLVGDFNGWDLRCMPMIGDPNGWWTYELRLGIGSYEFRYYGDGKWCIDYAAFGLAPGPFGWNSVVLVRPYLLRRDADFEASRSGRNGQIVHLGQSAFSCKTEVPSGTLTTCRTPSVDRG